MTLFPAVQPKTQEWPKVITKETPLYVADVAKMPEEIKRWERLFGDEQWLSFSYKPVPAVPPGERMPYTSYIPASVEVDCSPVLNALASKRIARAWYGVNCEAKEVNEISAQSAHAGNTTFTAVPNDPFASEVNFISLLFELPDGTKAGPGVIPNTALKAPAIPEEVLDTLNDWEQESEPIAVLEDKKIRLTLYEGKSSSVVNALLENLSNLQMMHPALRLRASGKERIADFSEFRIWQETFIPPNARWGINNLFYRTPDPDKNSSYDEDSLMAMLSFADKLRLSSFEFSVNGSDLRTQEEDELPGLEYEVFSRERLGNGYETVMLKITNKTGRKINNFQSSLEARSPSGKLLDKAAETCDLRMNVNELYQGSVIYMRYLFKSAEPFPEGTQFVLKLTEMLASPMLLVGDSARMVTGK